MNLAARGRRGRERGILGGGWVLELELELEL